jgi:hypothetical protein
VNGYYSKNGTRCTTSVATNECPVAVKVKFVYNCDTSDTNNYKNGKCVRASTIEAYHAIYQEKTIPGEAPIKPIIVGDSNVDGNAIAATPISTNSLAGYVYDGFKCSAVTPIGSIPYIQLGTDKYGAPICGVDPNQQTIDALKEEMCKIKMQNIWQNGGTTTAPCDIITVNKIFNLSNTGTTKNTQDCLNGGGRVKYSGTVVATSSSQIPSAFQSYPGGKLSGTSLTEAQFKTKYGIVTNPPTFLCEIRSQANKGQSWSSSGVLSLGADFVPGSLYINAVQGGGGGGGGAGGTDGGYGGGAGGFDSGSLSSVVTPQTCSVTIGGGGSGASAGKNSGGSGGGTSISCGNFGSRSAGGGGGGGNGGGCGGSGGAGTRYGGGGAGEGKDAGHGAESSHYGAGGGGGGTCGTSGQHSGGSGAGGYVEAGWKEFIWVTGVP